MSSTTTIEMNPDLKALWTANLSSGLRAIICQINNEVLVLKDTIEGTASRDSDFGLLMSKVNASEPCFVLFRDNGSHWVFISFVPDKASVRDKMLYASANTNIRKEFGDDHFTQAARFSILSEFCWSSFQESLKPVECLSEREEHIRELDKAEETARKEMMESASNRNPLGTSIANTVAQTAAEKNAKKAASKPAAATTTASSPVKATTTPAKTTTTGPAKTTTASSSSTTGPSKKPSVGALTKNFEHQANTHLTGVAREGQTGGASHVSYSTQIKPKASESTVNAPHPVYSKIQGSSGPMKKVVIPPSGAYC